MRIYNLPRYLFSLPRHEPLRTRNRRDLKPIKGGEKRVSVSFNYPIFVLLSLCRSNDHCILSFFFALLFFHFLSRYFTNSLSAFFADKYSPLQLFQLLSRKDWRMNVLNVNFSFFETRNSFLHSFFFPSVRKIFILVKEQNPTCFFFFFIY